MRSARSSSGRERLVGYCRVSSEEQARGGISIAAQRDRIAGYVIAHDVELVGIESDEGVSGRLSPMRRPGLSRAIDAVRSGAADGLVVVRLDRLSRTTRDVLDLVDECGRDAWRLVSVSEHLDTGSAAGRLVVTVLAALAQMEREQGGERTRSVLDRLSRQGLAAGRFTPFGFHLRDDSTEQTGGGARRLLPDPKEQRLLERIRDLRKRGLGARRIARDLNERGDVNPRTGREWTSELMQRIIATAERRERAGIPSAQPKT